MIYLHICVYIYVYIVQCTCACAHVLRACVCGYDSLRMSARACMCVRDLGAKHLLRTCMTSKHACTCACAHVHKEMHVCECVCVCVCG